MIHKVQSKVETTLLTAYPTFGVEVKLMIDSIARPRL